MAVIHYRLFEVATMFIKIIPLDMYMRALQTAYRGLKPMI